MSEDSFFEKIQSLVDENFEHKSVEFDEDNPEVPLANSPYGTEEIMEVFDSLMSTYVTMGDKVSQFERDWSDYVGKETGVMTNSGSSANLLALKSISEEFGPNPEVIVPAVGWSTTVFPVVDAGAKPVFVDVDPERFAIDVDEIEKAINENTEAIVLVHLLGNPAPMDKILELCESNDLYLIEDCAEAHGAEYNGQEVGSFGDIGTFSFSFSHHITTSEGGIAVTDSEKFEEKMKIMRSWGRIRDIEDISEYTDGESEIDPEFLFADHGYNLRPTEIQASFGIHQTKKIEGFVEQRRQSAHYLNKELDELDQIHVLKEKDNLKCSYLHYPIIIDKETDVSRKEFREYLEKKGIETRPLLSGNMTEHPAFQSEEYKTNGKLGGASLIHENGLYISNHHYLTEKHLDYMINTVKEFFSN